MSILVATCGGMQCDDRLSRHASRTRRATRGWLPPTRVYGVAWLAALSVQAIGHRTTRTRAQRVGGSFS